MIQYQLGRSIAQILPFQVTKQIAEPKPQMWEPLSMPVMVVMEILHLYMNKVVVHIITISLHHLNCHQDTTC